MSLRTRALSLLWRLPPARFERWTHAADLRVAMPDGTELLTDRVAPAGPGPWPTVLIRTPYGRRAPFTWLAELFAERGYATVLQSCRGTFGSGGTFDPFHHEATDGAATLEWLCARPDTGALAMFGPSYLGYTQWAVAGHPALRAHAMQVTTAEFHTTIHTGGSFSLETMLGWAHVVGHQELPLMRMLRAHLAGGRALARAFRHLPMGTADEVALERAVPFYRAWLAHRPSDPYWTPIDHTARVAQTAAPVQMVSGWYDIFLPEMLADYARLRRAGRRPQLTVGPWTHSSPGVLGTAVREALQWFDAHLLGHGEPRAKPVHVQLMGTSQWLELEDWPPPAAATRWYLHAGGGLAQRAPAEGPPAQFEYDPADPTPSVGGTILAMRSGGRKYQRALEARDDVAVYTTSPLEADVDVIGTVVVELFVATSLEHADVFARLCDVDPLGRSVNVCDTLVRLAPGAPEADVDGVRAVRLELFPTAQRFVRGHRIRLQVSGGAHPRFARNLGTGEDPHTGASHRRCAHRVFQDPRHPSAVVLPVVAREPPASRPADAEALEGFHPQG